MWLIKEGNSQKEKEFVDRGFNDIIAKLLSQRNILGDINKFLDVKYSELSHPHTLLGVEEAVKTFCDAIKNKRTIGVYSDYDTDGVLSAVCLRELCEVFGAKCKVVLPSRLEHGYGLSDKTVALLKEKFENPPDLLFIADCGSSNETEIKALKEWSPKTKIIIIDHHIIEETKKSKSADVLINWHQNNSQEMCACGEVFQFIRGIRWVTKKINPIEFLSYAAVATIADVSPIVGDNRIIVKHGLTSHALNHITASGLKALLQVSYINPNTFSQQDVQFKIAPKINAVGRLYYPDIIYGLLIERDMDIAKNTAEHVLSFNDERKEKQKNMEEEALSLAKKTKCKNGILVHSEEFHIGVVGIVAAKIVEKFNLPTVVVGKSNDKWKGSCRSIGNIDIKKILDRCPELFEAYGGHSMAAGVTMKPDMLGVAAQIFDKACSDYYNENGIIKDKTRYYDVEINIDQINPEVSRLLLDTIYPYCNENNNEPIFVLKDIEIVGTTVKEGATWRLFSFYAQNGDKKLEYPFKFFTTKYGSEIEGRKAKIMFTFPQKKYFTNTLYDKFELTVKDIVINT